MGCPAVPWADSGVVAGQQLCNDRPTDRRCRRPLHHAGGILSPSLPRSDVKAFTSQLVHKGEGKGGTRGEGELSPHSPHVFHNHVPRRT